MPPGETLFVTFRLHGTLPYEVLSTLRDEHERFVAIQLAKDPDVATGEVRQRWEARYFLAMESYLDDHRQHADWLTNAAVAEVIKEAIHFRDTRQFDLHAYCVMPNHVHLLVTNDHADAPFHQILGSLKANSAKKANIILERTGKPLWASESYDHVVRNGKSFERIIGYILNNPVKAGLAEKWTDWPHSFCKYDW